MAQPDPAHEDYYAEAEQTLREGGFRVTPQRAAILELLSRQGGHWTAQEVFGSLADQVPSLSLATVYNTLETFEDLGLLARVTGQDGQTYFDRNVSDHQHALCDQCGEMFDVVIPGPTIEVLQSSCRFRDGDSQFEVRAATVWFRGICPSCR